MWQSYSMRKLVSHNVQLFSSLLHTQSLNFGLNMTTIFITTILMVNALTGYASVQFPRCVG